MPAEISLRSGERKHTVYFRPPQAYQCYFPLKDIGRITDEKGEWVSFTGEEVKPLVLPSGSTELAITGKISILTLSGEEKVIFKARNDTLHIVSHPAADIPQTTPPFYMYFKPFGTDLYEASLVPTPKPEKFVTPSIVPYVRIDSDEPGVGIRYPLVVPRPGKLPVRLIPGLWERDDARKISHVSETAEGKEQVINGEFFWKKDNEGKGHIAFRDFTGKVHYAIPLETLDITPVHVVLVDIGNDKKFTDRPARLIATDPRKISKDIIKSI